MGKIKINKIKKMNRYNRRVCLLLALFSMQFGYAQQMAENPFVRTDTEGNRMYTADPSARVWTIDGEEVLFVYPSQDNAPPQGCDLMDKYHVFSTTDMVNWTDHGEILRAADVPWQKEPLINDGKAATFMWAPDCVYKDGKYYFYFPHPDKNPWNNNWKIGIAVSDKPASDFVILDETLKGLPESGEIDPCVFIDDDGQAYFYYGGGGRCFGAKLKDNMIELDGELQTMQGLSYFHEGAWLHKRNGIYYLSYPGNNSSLKNYISGQDQLLYATSNSPLGPWEYKGAYLYPTGCDTSHGSIVEYKGQWYAFYHNIALSNIGQLRSICVDKLYYNEDGTIQPVIQTGMDKTINRQTIPGIIEAEDFMNGGEGAGYHDKDEINSGGTPYRMSGVDISVCKEDGFYVTSTEDGEWLKYNVRVNQTNTYRLEMRIASATAGGVLHVEIDEQDVTGAVEIPLTNGEQEWSSIFIHDIDLASGNHTMKVCIDKGGFNVNNFMFALDTPAPIGKLIRLQNSSSYVTIKNNQLFCNKKLPITDTEKFLVVDNGDGSISLKGDNDRFVENGSPMQCSRKLVGSVTKFIWCALSSDEVVLRSLQHNKVVCSESGTKAMNCDRTEIGGWETFTWKAYDVAAIEGVNATNNEIYLFPVPANEEVTVRFSLNTASKASILIFDMQGKIIKTTDKNLEGGLVEVTMDVSDINGGLYMIQIITSELNEVRKLIII